MKKCVRCGIEVEDDAKTCEECGFDFEEYEKILKHNTITIKTDPIDMTKEEKMLRLERPILTFIFGFFGVFFALMIVASPSIMMMALGFIFSILSIVFSTKPSLVKLIPLQNVGKWFGYAGFVLSLFFTVYSFMGMLF